MLQQLVIGGLGGVARRERFERNLPIQSGDRFDRVKIDMAMDTIASRLRNAGYPDASVENTYATRPTANGIVADDSISVHPGPYTRIGAVTVHVDPMPGKKQQITDQSVRNIVGIDSGALYRERNLSEAQRALYETDAYAHVAVVLDTARAVRVNRSPVDSVVRDSVVVPLAVGLVETPMHSARLGLGYGTLDCFRATSELDDYNFLGDARRLELRGRISKIGVGRPLDGASSLCPQARNDPYSTRLNYYLGATLKQPVFLGLHTVPTLTAFTSRVSEYNAYVRTTTIGGIASLTWAAQRRMPVTFSYKIDFGRTEAQPALFCAVFNLCTAEDRERVQENQRLGVASVALVRDWTNNPTTPTNGGALHLEWRHASALTFSDSSGRFNTLLGDLSGYIPFGDAVVLAVRLRGGRVFGNGFIPPQERMFAGGATTVRGYRQNELGSITYTAVSYDTVFAGMNGADSTFYFRGAADSLSAAARNYRRAVPVGGSALVVGNVELRIRSPFLPEVLQFGLFADAGDVWNPGRGDAFASFRLKITPGVQVAAITPIGPVRVSLGYNPYPRAAGPLYYESTAAAGGALPCVTPGNSILVRYQPDDPSNPSGPRHLEQDPLGTPENPGCPATYKPPKNSSFRSRLTLNLAIGQAF
jgi:outer membrane protein insertion porin family/translocation and assembly module TamA